MGSKKWVFAMGAAGLITAGLVAGGYYLNASFQESFAKAVKDLGAGATGRTVTVGDVDLNLFKGTGSFSDLRVSSGSKDPDILILDSFAVEFSPWSLLSNEIKVEALTVGKVTVNAVFTVATLNLFAVTAAAAAYAGKPNAEYGETKITLNTLEVKPGVLNITFNIPGRKMHKSLPLSGYKSDMSEQAAGSPVKLVTGFVKDYVGRATNIARRG